MSDSELKTLSSFKWASVAQYMVYITNAAGLKEINSEKVVSFSLSRMGPGKLIKAKTKTLERLESNISKLERFAGEYRARLDDDELAILRTLYLQYKRGVGQVKYHIRLAKRYKAETNQGDLIMREDDKNALPF